MNIEMIIMFECLTSYWPGKLSSLPGVINYPEASRSVVMSSKQLTPKYPSSLYTKANAGAIPQPSHLK